MPTPSPANPQPNPGPSGRRGPHPPDVRPVAIQALYVIDTTEQTDAEALPEALDEPFDDGDPESPADAKAPAVELALAAWAVHDRADAQLSRLAPDWPTHRQPPVDRAILRLAWYELEAKRADPAVIIDEAIRLAQRFSDERAPAFVNGLLDRVAKRLSPDGLPSDSGDSETPDDGPPSAPPPVTSDDWLNDAVRDR